MLMGEKRKAYRKIYDSKHKKEIKAYNEAYRFSHKEEEKARHKAYYLTHKEKIKTYRLNNDKKIKNYRKVYYSTHREELKSLNKSYYLDNKEKYRAYNISSKYGITLQQYNDMFEKQQGHCAICSKSKKLCVDHCHRSKKIRGLLCSNCNTLLGYAKDSPTILRLSINYLKINAKRLPTTRRGKDVVR